MIVVVSSSAARAEGDRRGRGEQRPNGSEHSGDTTAGQSAGERPRPAESHATAGGWHRMRCFASGSSLPAVRQRARSARCCRLRGQEGRRADTSLGRIVTSTTQRSAQQKRTNNAQQHSRRGAIECVSVSQHTPVRQSLLSLLLCSCQHAWPANAHDPSACARGVPGGHARQSRTEMRKKRRF